MRAFATPVGEGRRVETIGVDRTEAWDGGRCNLAKPN